MAKTTQLTTIVIPVTGKTTYIYSTPEKPRTRPCAYSP